MEQEDPLLARIRESDMQRSRWMHEVFGGQTLHPDMEQQIRDVVMDQCSPNPVAQATGRKGPTPSGPGAGGTCE